MIKAQLIIVLMLIGLNNSIACICEETVSVKESFKYSDAVFHGKVIYKSLVTFAESIDTKTADSIRKNLDENELKMFDSKFIIKVQFVIKQYYKSNVLNDTIIIYTTRTSASCGYQGFEIGKDYIVYASTKSYAFGSYIENDNESRFEKQNTFWTNQCTRTDEYHDDEAKELEKFIK